LDINGSKAFSPLEGGISRTTNTRQGQMPNANVNNVWTEKEKDSLQNNPTLREQKLFHYSGNHLK